MKQITLGIMIVLCNVFNVIAAPSITNETWSITTAGFWRPIISEPDVYGGDHVDFGSSRVAIDVKNHEFDMSAKAQVEFANIDEGYGVNWLRQAWISSTNLLGGTYRVGRLFVAGGYSTPSIDNTVTAPGWPRVPYNLYAWGVQGEYNVNGWQIIADVSGKSGVAFDSDENDDDLESSFYIVRDISSYMNDAFGNSTKGVAGFVGQMSADEQKIGYLGKAERGGTKVSMEIYHVESTTDSFSGGYYLIEQHLIGQVSVHGRYDIRLNSGSDRLIVGGLMWKGDKDQYRIIVDWNEYLDTKEDESGIYAATLIRF